MVKARLVRVTKDGNDGCREEEEKEKEKEEEEEEEEVVRV